MGELAAKMRRGARAKSGGQSDDMVMEVMFEERDVVADQGHEEDTDEHKEANFERNYSRE